MLLLDLHRLRLMKKDIVSLINDCLYQRKEPDRVDVKTPVQVVNVVVRNACVGQCDAIYSVSRNWVLMILLQNRPRDIVLFSIGQDIIQPLFDDPGVD